MVIMCLARGGVGGEGGEWIERIGFGLYQSYYMCLCFGCGGWVVYGEWVLDRGRERWGGVILCEV